MKLGVPLFRLGVLLALVVAVAVVEQMVSDASGDVRLQRSLVQYPIFFIAPSILLWSGVARRKRILLFFLFIAASSVGALWVISHAIAKLDMNLVFYLGMLVGNGIVSAGFWGGVMVVERFWSRLV